MPINMLSAIAAVFTFDDAKIEGHDLVISIFKTNYHFQHATNSLPQGVANCLSQNGGVKSTRQPVTNSLFQVQEPIRMLLLHSRYNKQ